MKREFVHAESFEKSWTALGLTDDDLRIFRDGSLLTKTLFCQL